LNALAIQVPHLIIGERGAAIPDLDHQPHDGVAVRISHPLGGPDRIAFNQGAYDLGPAGERKTVHGQSPNLMGRCFL
jgi:hypothetical protein